MAESILIVKKNETITIGKNREKLLVDNWVMEDNSTIILGDDIEKWEINASKASFGANCKITGLGYSGENGVDSSAHGNNGRECNDGGHGGNGTDATNGTNGKSIVITMGLIEVNDLTIDVSGGNGGKGGNGANGGKGGRASCGRICNGQEGGNGGSGGKAGRGGNGGNVKIEYWVASTKEISMGTGKGLSVVSKGGKSGVPGNGGAGGEGGDGRKCWPGRRKGGSRGRTGIKGRNSSNGIKGQVVYNVVPQP